MPIRSGYPPISETKRTPRDPLVSKRPDFQCRFLLLKLGKGIVNEVFCDTKRKVGGMAGTNKAWAVQGTRGLPPHWAGAGCNPRYLLLHLHIAHTAGTIVMIVEAGQYISTAVLSGISGRCWSVQRINNVSSLEDVDTSCQLQLKFYQNVHRCRNDKR